MLFSNDHADMSCEKTGKLPSCRIRVGTRARARASEIRTGGFLAVPGFPGVAAWRASVGSLWGQIVRAAARALLGKCLRLHFALLQV